MPNGLPVADPTQPERLLYRLQEAADVLGVSLATVNRLVRSNELRVAKIGGSVRVPASEIRNLVSRKLGG